jgi:hypothetical protein
MVFSRLPDLAIITARMGGTLIYCCSYPEPNFEFSFSILFGIVQFRWICFLLHVATWLTKLQGSQYYTEFCRQITILSHKLEKITTLKKYFHQNLLFKQRKKICNDKIRLQEKFNKIVQSAFERFQVYDPVAYKFFCSFHAKIYNICALPHNFFILL